MEQIMLSRKEKGDTYESFVAKVYNAIAACGTFDGNHKTIELQLKHKLPDTSGNLREIDIYWEYELMGEVFKVGIECKDYKTSIPVDRIEAFATKIESLGLNKGIFATKIGYQKSAIDTAKFKKISLMVIREVTDKDLEDRIRKIVVDIHANLPIKIEQVKYHLDIDWLETNTSLKEGDLLSFQGMNNEIIIEDITRNEKYSFYDLEEKLRNAIPGKHEWQQKYQDAYIVFRNQRYKILGLMIQYTKPQDLVTNFTVTDTGFYLAVLEYISGDRKKKILKPDGKFIN